MQLPVDNVIAGVGPVHCHGAAPQLVAGCLVPLQISDHHILGRPDVVLCRLPYWFSRAGMDLNIIIFIKGAKKCRSQVFLKLIINKN